MLILKIKIILKKYFNILSNEKRFRS
jgi:hypothetical protein